MIRFAPNTSQKIYYQDIRFAMIIPGEIKHREGNQVEEEKLLRAGDSWTQKADSTLHIENYPTEETTLLYIHCDRLAGSYKGVQK